jgi:hypothetical protein
VDKETQTVRTLGVSADEVSDFVEKLVAEEIEEEIEEEIVNEIRSGEEVVSVVASTGSDEAISGNDYEVNEFIYTSGNVTINNYESWEKIQINSNYESWAVDGNDFVINTDEGSVRVTNVRGKMMSFVDGDGNGLMNACLQTAGDKFEGTVYDIYGDVTYGTYTNPVVIVGANDGENTMWAGTGGSSLWGGSGKHADILMGSEGEDTFIYHYGEGNDMVLADEEDTVDLSSVSVEQIRQLKLEDNRVLCVFDDYSTLDVAGRIGKFLVDGNTYQVDYDNKVVNKVVTENQSE